MCFPLRAVTLRRDSCDLCEIIGGIMRSHLSSAQINHPLWGIQKPRVRIPLVNLSRNPSICLCNSLDRGYGLSTHKVLWFVLLIRLIRQFPTYGSDKIKSQQRFLLPPTLAVVSHPLPPFRD